MKKTFVFTTLLAVASSCVAHTVSCRNDFEQIKYQFDHAAIDVPIHTKNGIDIYGVRGPATAYSGGFLCSAFARGPTSWISKTYAIYWSKSHWEETIVAADRAVLRESLIYSESLKC